MARGPIIGAMSDAFAFGRDHVGMDGNRPTLKGKKKKNGGPRPSPDSTDRRRTTDKKPTVLRLQEFLNNRGYKIPEDGFNGPLTKAAAADFNQTKGPKRNAKAFNTKHKLGAASVSPSKPGGKSGGGNGKGKAGGTTQVQSDPLMSILGGTDDYAKIGRAVTEQQYGAPISNMRHEIGQEKSQEKHDVSTVQGWFENLVSQNKAGAVADQAALGSTLKDSSGLLANILGSLGDESARAQVGRTALFNEGELKGIGLAEGNFDRNMNTALALKGRDEATRYENDSRGKQSDMRSQLEGLIMQKAGALTTNTEAARDQGLRRRGESINQAATLALLPAQMEGADLGNILTALNIQGTEQELNKPQPGSFVPWAKLDPKSKREQFDMALTGSGAFGPEGNLMSNPSKAAEKIRIAMNQSGYSVKKNPMLATWIRTAVNQALARSKGSGQWTAAKPI